MKKQGKLLLLLSFLVVGCGSVSTNPSITPTLPPVDGETTTSGIPTRPNDFLEDPDRVEGDEVIPDTAKDDDGELIDYKFEFESARYEGSSNGKDHQCVPQSIELNLAFSGNVCMKNIGSGASFVFSFTSTKNVRSPLKIKCSNAYIKGQSFSNAYTITINGQEFVETSIVPENGVLPEDLSSKEQYFTMVEVTGKISLQEGQNTLKITSNTNSCPNMDALIISTSSTLVDSTKSNWPNIFANSTIDVMPTDDELGKVTYGCTNSGCTTVATKPLPNLKSGLYKIETSDTTDIMSLLIGNSYYSLIEKYLLKVQEAKFEDGSTEMKLSPGSKPTIVLDNPNQGIFEGWVNVNDNNETYPETFVMPNKPLTIKPRFEKLKASTLTLVNATFSDGTTSKEVNALEELSMNVVAPEGKKHVGWYDVNSPEIYYNGTIFIMPNHPITIAPVFKPNSYVTSDNGYIDLGEASSTSSSGYADYIENLTFVNGSGTGDRVTSHAGNGEYGTVLDLNVKADNALFRMKTTYSIAANTTYQQTYVVYNFSSESVTLTLDQVNTKTESAGFSKTVTIESGKSSTITLEYKFSSKNNHSLVVFKFAKAMTNCKLGVTSSVVKK